MSSLRSKLQRLPNAGPVGSRLAQGVPAPTPEPEPANELPPQPVPVPTQDMQRAQTLERLRNSIARILAREAPPKAPPADPSAGELPFAVQDTPQGPLYVRRVVYEPWHRVGRFPVHAGRSAHMEMLSLLALDPAIAACSAESALYLDTETTGLSGGTGTLAFLIGLGWYEHDGSFVVEQLLLRSPGQEAPMLERVASRLSQASMLVTFNGKAFDAPLVRTRFVMNRMPVPSAKPHLDLLHIARRVHRTRLAACNLGTIEERVLGFGRVGDVPSGEVSARYAHFLRTGEAAALAGVIEHNAWDVVAMAALLGLYGEPTDGLGGEDLAGVAATVYRAKQAERAAELADEAVHRGGGPAALRTRATIAKARGERDRALVDFEQLLCEVDDPQVRLELAKLYEHHKRCPEQALQLVHQGVTEDEPALARRCARLERKIAKGQQPKDPTARKRRRRGPQDCLPGLLPPDRKSNA